MKLFRSINLKRIKRALKSRSLIGSILFATSLWGYTSLNHEYTPFVRIPLRVILPDNKAIENPLPKNISVKVRGSGWQLFYLMFFNSNKGCTVDLTDRDISTDEFIISRTDFMKGIQNIVDAEPIDVVPETMKLVIGQLVTRKVPVNPIITITPRDGFVAMNEFKITPDSIEITGNETTVKNIRYWNTEKINVEGVYKPTTVTLALSDTLSTIIKKSLNNVHVTFDVQQEADITIYDVPVRIRGGILPKNHIIKPDKIKVLVTGGVKQIAEISQYNIESFIDYTEIINDTSGIIIPKVEINRSFNKFYTLPKYLYHYRVVKSVN
jgi:YbbR domain-containing protein